MREINMQKTVRNAANLHAKNTAKCVTFLQIFHIFFAYEFCAFFSVFCRKICRKLCGNFLYFSSFFMMIFMKLCAGMGKAGSRSNPGVNVAIPIGIALKKNSFLQREINEKRNWRQSWKMPLVTSSAAAAEIEMKGLFYIFEVF